MAATDKPTSDRLRVPRKVPAGDDTAALRNRLFAVQEHFARRLHSRDGHDLTAVFPEIAHAVETLPCDDFVLDGEGVVHDDEGRPSFQRLQKRGRLTQRYDIRRGRN